MLSKKGSTVRLSSLYKTRHHHHHLCCASELGSSSSRCPKVQQQRPYNIYKNNIGNREFLPFGGLSRSSNLLRIPPFACPAHSGKRFLFVYYRNNGTIRSTRSYNGIASSSCPQYAEQQSRPGIEASTFYVATTWISSSGYTIRTRFL